MGWQRAVAWAEEHEPERAVDLDASAVGPAATPAASQLSLQLARAPVPNGPGGGPPGWRLPVSRPEDPEERAAERTADRVMRPAGAAPVPRAAGTATLFRDPSGPLPAQPGPDVAKQPDQPSTFPAQEQPKSDDERAKDIQDKLKKGGGEALSLTWDLFSGSTLGKRVTDRIEQDPAYRFFTRNPLGLVTAVALGVGGFTAGIAAEWSGRDPGAPGAAPKDEKITTIELSWDFMSPPASVKLKTPWLTSPTLPPPKPAPTPQLEAPPQLLKVKVHGIGICTPTSDHPAGGPDDGALFYLWLRQRRRDGELVDPIPQKDYQLHAPQPGDWAPKLMFDRRPGATPAPDSAVVDRALSSPFTALDPQDRRFMETRFGTDLGGVRLHSGPEASAAATAVNANAFTVGSDVVFADGRYTPGTTEGRRLLAHELSHVLHVS